jgi:hypothetical protein
LDQSVRFVDGKVDGFRICGYVGFVFSVNVFQLGMMMHFAICFESQFMWEQKCTLSALQRDEQIQFCQNNPTLFVDPYRVQSLVSLSIFRQFISALEANAINITHTNFTEVQRLCKEFCFSELAAKHSEFRPSMEFKEAEDADARGRIAALEEKANQHSHVIAILQDKLTHLSTYFGRFRGEVSVLRSAAAGIQTVLEEVSAMQTQIAQKQSDPVVEQFSTDFSELGKEVSTQKAQIAAMSLTVTASQNQPPLLHLHSLPNHLHISRFRRGYD